MTIQINYKNSASKNIFGNLILFVNEKYDIEVKKRVPLALNANPHNQHYLKTKQNRTGHLMDSF